MAATKAIIDRLGFDPETDRCRHCWAEADTPCKWDVTPPETPYHAERLEDAQFAASVEAGLAGTAPNGQQWKDAVKAAAEELV